MTLKELNQAFWLQQEIAGLSRQLEEMRERASTIPSAGFDNMPTAAGQKSAGRRSKPWRSSNWKAV